MAALLFSLPTHLSFCVCLLEAFPLCFEPKHINHPFVFSLSVYKPHSHWVTPTPKHTHTHTHTHIHTHFRPYTKCKILTIVTKESVPEMPPDVLLLSEKSLWMNRFCVLIGSTWPWLD